MPEQAARSSADPRPKAPRTRDGNVRRAEDLRPAGDANRSARAQRNLRAAPDLASGNEGDRLASPPRRTVVIRGQATDRYSSRSRSSASRRTSRSYGMGLRPERAAFWAVLLGFALVVAALATAHL